MLLFQNTVDLFVFELLPKRVLMFRTSALEYNAIVEIEPLGAARELPLVPVQA